MNTRRRDILDAINRLHDAAHEALQKRHQLRSHQALEKNEYKAKRLELQVGECDKALSDIEDEIIELKGQLA